MIHLHMTPLVFHIRAYNQPNGYENRLPYQAILTGTHKTSTHVELCGLHGKVDLETWNKAFDLLRSIGVKTVEIERRGQWKTIDLAKPISPDSNTEEIS